MAARIRLTAALLLTVAVSILARVTCPEPCVCIPTDRAWENVVADCSNKSLTKVPMSFSSKVVVLNASLNYFKELSEDFFLSEESLNLKTVFLSSCGIETIDRSTFQRLEQLWILDLSSNKLVNLDKNTFEFNSKLWYLILKGNNIYIPPHNPLLVAPRLSKLDLSYNGLTTLYSETFSHVHKLTYLQLHNNRFQKLSQDWFHHLKKLNHLLLHENELTHISRDTFADLTHLLELTLSKNKVVVPLGGPFLRIPSLESLYLRECNITYIPAHFFEFSRRLRYLYLGGNQLKTLDAGALQYLDQLVELSVPNNQLTCDCDLKEAWLWCFYHRVKSDVECSTPGDKDIGEGGDWEVLSELACNATESSPVAAPASRNQVTGPSAGQVVGYVVLALLLVSAAVAVAFFFWRRSTRSQQRLTNSGSMQTTRYADMLPLNEDQEDA